MSEWPFLLCLHFFLLFFHPHASHQVTINASTQALTFVHDIRQKKKIQIFSSLGRMSLCFLQPIFLLLSVCPTRLMSCLIKGHSWQMVGLKTLEPSSLNELFHQEWDGTHVYQTPNTWSSNSLTLKLIW